MRILLTPVLTLVVVSLSGCGLRVGAPSAAALPSRFPSSDARTPYPETASWFGYLAEDTPPDTAEGEEPLHHLYVWLPNAAPELGVRVVSPVAGWTTPQPEDRQDPAYAAHAALPTGFDPKVTLERCVNAMNPEDLQAPCEYWAALGENDDSTELPPPPGSKAKTHALMRAVSDPDEQLQALIRGLYRISVWSAKGTKPNGTFWVQIGAARDVGPILIARTPGELATQLE